MGGACVDISGQRFGMLTAIEIIGIQNKKAKWLCKCDCGNEKAVRIDHLNGGRVQSCGCLGREKRKASLTKHNQSRTRLYYVWYNMKKRCYNKNVRSYKNYGQNGVTVCDEWRNDFVSFSKWAFANGYDPDAEYGKCTIDRINVYGNYCPENCRFVDAKTQANNKRGRKYE